jgi:hypothetical protein
MESERTRIDLKRQLSSAIAKKYPEAMRGKIDAILLNRGQEMQRLLTERNMTLLDLADLTNEDWKALLLLREGYFQKNRANELFAKIEKALGVKLDGSTELE